MATIEMLGILVGIDKDNQNNKGYRILTANLKALGVNKYNWNFKATMMNEQQLINSIVHSTDTFKWLNVTVSNGKIKGINASLSRFESTKGHHPYLIISQLENQDSKIVGYKVANYDGNVKNIPIRELIAYGERTTKIGEIPVQNAVFIPSDGKRRGHFKPYSKMEFIIEVVESQKNKHVEEKKVNVVKNAKTLSRLEEIYSREQIEQLRLGKQNGIDIRIIANPQLSAEQMKTLREGLESGVNVKPFAFPEYQVLNMKTYILDLQNGINIKAYLSPKYDLGQLAELSLATELGLDISKMSNPKMSANDMAEIRQRLQYKIWKDELVKKDGSWI